MWSAEFLIVIGDLSGGIELPLVKLTNGLLLVRTCAFARLPSLIKNSVPSTH